MSAREDFRKARTALEEVLADAGSTATVKHTSTEVQLTLLVSPDLAPLSGGELPPLLHADLVRHHLQDAGVDSVVIARNGRGPEIDILFPKVEDVWTLVTWVAGQLPGPVIAARRLREALARAGLGLYVSGSRDRTRVYLADIEEDKASALFRALGADDSAVDGMNDLDNDDLDELAVSLMALIHQETGATILLEAHPMCDHHRYHALRFGDLEPAEADRISAYLESRPPAAEGEW